MSSDNANAFKDIRAGDAPNLPWIHTYGTNEAEGENARAFDTGWRAAKASKVGAECPFPKGSMSAASWCAALAFHKELGS